MDVTVKIMSLTKSQTRLSVLLPKVSIGNELGVSDTDDGTYLFPWKVYTKSISTTLPLKEDLKTHPSHISVPSSLHHLTLSSNSQSVHSFWTDQ